MSFNFEPRKIYGDFNRRDNYRNACLQDGFGPTQVYNPACRNIISRPPAVTLLYLGL